MSAKNTEQPEPFKLRLRHPVHWFARTFIMKPFYKKPKITVLEPITEPAIFVSNHDAKRGPVVSDVYFPVRTAKWGAYEMLCGYNTRRKYLRDVFYRKKQGMGKFMSSFKSFFEAFFSIGFYRGMNIMPTYPDARLTKTLSMSMDVLDRGVSLYIFPEDSDGGYREEMTKFFPGFVMLAESYYKRTGRDVPIYPVYYHSGCNKMVIGRPRHAHKLKEEGLDRNAVAELFRQDVNALLNDYIKEN